jgi:hypothetical protein
LRSTITPAWLHQNGGPYCETLCSMSQKQTLVNEPSRVTFTMTLFLLPMTHKLNMLLISILHFIWRVLSESILIWRKEKKTDCINCKVLGLFHFYIFFFIFTAYTKLCGFNEMVRRTTALKDLSLNIYILSTLNEL